MAKSEKKSAKTKGRGGKGADKQRKGDAKHAKARGGSYASIATHPRARASVRRVKAWVGLAGFIIAAVLSLRASVPVVEVGVRALIAGFAGYLLAWWIGMLVWRQLMLAEQRAAAEEISRRRDEHRQEAASVKQA